MLPLVSPVKLIVSIPPAPVAFIQAPPDGIDVVPHVEMAPKTGLKLLTKPSTVTTCVVAVAWNEYHTAFSEPLVQSPVSLLSVAPTVEPVTEVVHVPDVLTPILVAVLQMSFTGGGGGVPQIIAFQPEPVRLISLVKTNVSVWVGWVDVNGPGIAVPL